MPGPGEMASVHCLSPLARPHLPADGSILPVARSRALAAGSALETRGREPPSHHPCQRHLCHTPPMSQQHHEPDQESTGAAQQQCQRPLHSLCKSLPGPEEGGRATDGVCVLPWAGRAGQVRGSFQAGGKNGQRAWFSHTRLPQLPPSLQTSLGD